MKTQTPSHEHATHNMNVNDNHYFILKATQLQDEVI